MHKPRSYEKLALVGRLDTITAAQLETELNHSINGLTALTLLRFRILLRKNCS